MANLQPKFTFWLAAPGQHITSPQLLIREAQFAFCEPSVGLRQDAFYFSRPSRRVAETTINPLARNRDRQGSGAPDFLYAILNKSR